MTVRVAVGLLVEKRSAGIAKDCPRISGRSKWFLASATSTPPTNCPRLAAPAATYRRIYSFILFRIYFCFLRQMNSVPPLSVVRVIAELSVREESIYI